MYRFTDTRPRGGDRLTPSGLQTVFNGVNIDSELTDDNGFFRTLTVSGRSNTVYRREIIDIAGMDGAYEERDAYVEPREITVKFEIKDKTSGGFRERLERLNALLTGSKKMLMFTDEIAHFYASVTELEIPEEDSNDLVGNIIFFCSDPFKYGNVKRTNFLTDHAYARVDGTEEAEPIFELNVLRPTTFAIIQNHLDEYMMIGRPAHVDNTVFQKYETVFNDDASSLNGWTRANTGEIDGIISGTMQTSGYRFQTTDFGPTDVTGWHGPAVKRTLPVPLSDFRLEVTFTMQNTETKDIGRVEVYLLDVNGNQIGKISLRDRYGNRKEGFVEIVMKGENRNHWLVSEAGDRGWEWVNFYGVLRIEREGNVWRSYVAQVDRETGAHTSRRSTSFVDNKGEFPRNVGQVVAHVAQHSDYQKPTMGIEHIRVQRINQRPQAVPVIANTGDRITFDHEDKEIYINGEPMKMLKDFGASYFTLKQGINELVVLPEDTFSTNVRYVERYK